MVRETLVFWYNPLDNWFEDEEGNVVLIYEHVTPNDVCLFRHRKRHMLFGHRRFRGVGVELLYPGPGDCIFCRRMENGECPGLFEGPVECRKEIEEMERSD